jgi:type I restriction enzyme R subunit
MFHYWKDPVLFLLTKEPRLVDAEDVPADFLVRQPNDAVKYLLLEYNPKEPHGTDDIDILKTQRRGEIRYLPFVTTIDSVTKD